MRTSFLSPVTSCRSSSPSSPSRGVSDAMGSSSRTTAPRPNVVVMIVVALFVIAGTRLFGQAAGPYAFLVSQPVRGRSMPVLPANDLEYITARYEYRDIELSVYVVPQDAGRDGADRAVERSSMTWVRVPCSDLVVEQVSHGEVAPPVSRTVRRDYVLYVSGAVSNETLCDFLAVFAQTFEFFADALQTGFDDPLPPEFPAVLELPS